MRRLPNPWVLIPVAVAGIGSAIIGFQVTRVSCAPDTCTGAAVGIGLLAAILAVGGVGTVVVLAIRSFAEWRQLQARGGPPPPPVDPGPPTC
ncbi:hypothetical protein HQ535_04985 [bacterium]|nr:hypothetical protein [bacterium]